MDTTFLTMEHISKRYTGVEALKDVEFSIQHGEIHCLAGTNGSGKSTLVKIISGVETPDKGSLIRIDGVEYSALTAPQSIQLGIQVIYQDLSLFPNLSVAENIAMSEMMFAKNVFVSWKQFKTIASDAMAQIGVRIDLDKKVGDLSMADQQLVAICRALTKDVKLLIMDEPTTALTKREISALLSVITELKSKGISTLFISHKLNELMDVADRITILRDGVKVGCFTKDELNTSTIEFHMTGSTSHYEPYEVAIDTSQTPVLRVEGLGKQDNFLDISFSVHKQEIVGITGLLGSGRSELALALFGLNPPDEGKVYLNEEEITLASVKKAIDYGIAYVPENRLVEGLVLNQSISRNIAITALDELLDSANLLDAKSVLNHTHDWVRHLNIKTPSIDAPAKTLSGGNQQRIVLAKWIATKPKLFILDNPTVGIDVAAKASIHAIIRKLAQAGMAVIIISDEIAEVLANCNRVLVMNRGRVVANIDSHTTDEQTLQEFVDSYAV